jgi:hypothetical protein
MSRDALIEEIPIEMSRKMRDFDVKKWQNKKIGLASLTSQAD